MDNLKRMFDPETVAVIGASEREGSLGAHSHRQPPGLPGEANLHRQSHRETVCQYPCHASIDALPEHIDLAVVASPAATVPGIVDACGRAGVDGMIIISDGFREVGEEGRRLEEEIRRIKQNYPMRIVGPNCLGVIRPMRVCARPASVPSPRRAISPS